MSKRITWCIDLFLCLVLLPALIMLLPLDKWLDRDPKFVVLLFVWLYATYALHRLLTIPMLIGAKRRVLVAVTLLLFSLLGTYVISQYKLTPPPVRSEMERVARAKMKEHKMQNRRYLPTPMSAIQKQGVWFLFIVVTAFSIVVALLSELARQTAARQSIEFEKERAELSLYKAQINPHFLFNTLNTILGLVVSKSEMAEDAVVRFTELMRYMCGTATKAQVPIATEMEYIEEYIGLQRYRLSDHTKVVFENSIDAVAGAYQIAPMLLITFVENAIKYGASSQSESTIYISTRLVNGEFRLVTRNPIFEGHIYEKGAGIGVANCRKRLELLYPKRHNLEVVQGVNSYEVELRIKLF